MRKFIISCSVICSLMLTLHTKDAFSQNVQTVSSESGSKCSDVLDKYIKIVAPYCVSIVSNNPTFEFIEYDDTFIFTSIRTNKAFESLDIFDRMLYSSIANVYLFRKCITSHPINIIYNYCAHKQNTYRVDKSGDYAHPGHPKMNECIKEEVFKDKNIIEISKANKMDRTTIISYYDNYSKECIEQKAAFTYENMVEHFDTNFLEAAFGRIPMNKDIDIKYFPHSSKSR